MRGKSLTCRQTSLKKTQRSMTALGSKTLKKKIGPYRQVEDLPRIGVAKPFTEIYLNLLGANRSAFFRFPLRPELRNRNSTQNRQQRKEFNQVTRFGIFYPGE